MVRSPTIRVIADAYIREHRRNAHRELADFKSGVGFDGLP
jgi:hypothetical protein